MMTETDLSVVMLGDVLEEASDEQPEVKEPAKSVIKTLISLSCNFIAQCVKKDIKKNQNQLIESLIALDGDSFVLNFVN